MSEDGPEVPNVDKSSGLPDPTGEGSEDLPTASASGAAQSCPNVWGEVPPLVDLPEPGERWGKYQIEKLLGKGGQAVVYQAFDVMGPGGQVALKIPRVRVPSNRVQAWVEAEVGPLARLSHPHIVHVVDAGVIDDTPYIATQLAPESLPLDAYVKVHPPSRRQILTWMIQLTEAAGYAHDRGIIHRDLKPGNIVILRGGQPLIVDFGIASLVSVYQPQGEANSSGTPPFMAPEQARGDPDSDQRVDIFALGGVLKFLLEGAGPYGKTANALEAAKAGNIQKMDSGTGPGARRAMARIVNRALEPEAKDRFATAAEMGQALRSVRHRGVLRVVGVIALVVIALMVIEAVRWRDGPPQDLGLAVVAQANQWLLASDKVKAAEGYQAVLQMSQAGLVSKAEAAAGLGRIASADGRRQEAVDYYRQALAASPKSARALAGLAVLQADQGQYDEALASLRDHADDAWLARLARRIERGLALRDSLAETDRIRVRVDNLLRQYKERPKPEPGAAEDAWTSRPVGVCFYKIVSQGGLSLSEGEDDLLVSELTAAMLDRGRFKVVQREELDRILQELQLATSALADASAALRFGRLHSARALVVVTVNRSAEETRISLQTVDAETSEVHGVTPENLRGALGAAVVQRLVVKLEAVLEKAFPARGRISKVSDGTTTLNVGRKVGVHQGAVFSVFADEDSTEAIGELRVTSVRDDSSIAAVTSGTGQIKAGWRVQAKQ